MPPSAPSGRLNWPSRKPASKAGSRRPTANTICHSSFRCANLAVNAIDCPHGVAPERMPKADATGLAPKKSADHNPPVHDSLCGRVWLAPSHKSSLFLWCSSLSGGLGPKTRRPPGRLCRAFRIGFLDLLLVEYRSCLHRRVSYPTRVLPQHRRPVTQERNPKMRQGKKRTPSGENSVTRYSKVEVALESKILFSL